MHSPSQEQITWKARNAWRCAIFLLILEFIIHLWIQIARHNATASHWLTIHKYSFSNCLGAFEAGLWLFIAFLFSDLPSVQCFVEYSGLNLRPTLVGWWAAWAAVGVALLDRWGVVHASTYPNPTGHMFYLYGGVASLFYIPFVLLIGPFCDELVGRGFLYSAFRGSYGLLLSTILIIGFEVCFHWHAVTHSLCALGCLSALWILLCTVRETTRSVWNCILCHGAYNAVQVLTWPVYFTGIMLLLLICGSYGGPAPRLEININVEK